ncbi:MAG: hypothetical protein CL916_04385 [Deltaproteobacteria bacterium]|nr:hypothetical protein [Deltaproteobacteria bacterium]
MAKVKRGGTNPIDHVEELHDKLLMRFWIRRGTKSKKRSPFVFKKRCALLSEDPLLIVGPAGKKIKSSLVRATRVGSKTIRGFMYREGKLLIIETKDIKAENDQKKTARYIYSTLGKYKVRLPLKNIVLRNPAAKPPKNQSSAKKSKKTIIKSEDSSQESVSEESIFEESVDETITPKEWKEQERFLEEESSQDHESDEDPPNPKQARENLRETEAQYKTQKKRLKQKELQIKAYQNKLKKEAILAEQRLEIEQSFKTQCFAVQNASELNILLATSPLSKSAQKRIHRQPESERLDCIIQELRYARESREKELHAKQEKLLERDKSLDKKQLHSLDLEQERLDKKEELSLIVCQEKSNKISADLESLQNEPELNTVLGNYHFEQHWQELKAMLSQLQQHPKNEEFQMGDGDEIVQKEAQYKKIEEEYNQLLQSFDDLVDQWQQELKQMEQDISRLPTVDQQKAQKKFKALSSTLSSAISTMHKAVHKQQEYTQKSRLLEEVGSITADLIGDHREQSPNTPIHHTDPLDDLRLVNTRIHKQMSIIIEKTPSLRVMICHLIYRIQHIQEALNEKEAAGEKVQMASDSEVDGPLTPLWEQIPSSTDPNRFISEYKKWSALENRMWYLLGNPLETRTR